MKLLLLGTSGYHPTATRQTACVMAPELGVVFDAGTAMFRVREQLRTDELRIFLTHAHLDHVVGLTYLLGVTWEKPVRRVVVYGTAETLDAVRTHLFAPALFPVEPPFESCVLPDEVALPGGGRVTHFPLKHPGGAVGYRLDLPDRSFAYVTDTTATSDADYLEKIRGVDVLVHECYFNDGREELAELTGHSCVTPVAELASAAGVGRLILTHIDPLAPPDAPLDLAAAQRVFAQTELGYDGLTIEV